MHGPQYVRPHTSVNSPIWAKRILHSVGNDGGVTRTSTRAPSSAGCLLGRRDRHALAQFLVGQREVTGRAVAAGLLVEQRLLDRAHLLALPAARVETTRR